MNNNKFNPTEINRQNVEVEQDVEKAVLALEKNLEFSGTINGKITTCTDLAKYINVLFSSVFKDYEGSIITPTQQGQLGVTIYFKEKGGNNIIPLNRQFGNNKQMSPADRIKNMNLRQSNKTYTLSQELKDIIEQVTSIRTKGNINWDRMYHEVPEGSYGGISTINIQIDNIDINKILRILYGSKDDKGNKYDYNVSIIKPIGMGMGIYKNYIIKIDQLNVKEVEKLASKVGMMPSIGSIPMIRDK